MCNPVFFKSLILLCFFILISCAQMPEKPITQTERIPASSEVQNLYEQFKHDLATSRNIGLEAYLNSEESGEALEHVKQLKESMAALVLKVNDWFAELPGPRQVEILDSVRDKR